MKTNETKHRYKKRAEQLIHRAVKELQRSDAEAVDVSNWLINKKHELSNSTWRQYRSSLNYYFELKTHYFSIADAEMAIKLLAEHESDLCTKKGNKTSSQKVKKLNRNDLINLIEFSRSNPSKLGKKAVNWLISGLITGLRPCEWEHANFDCTKKTLTVKNAKNTNGRSHGEARVIHLEDIEDYYLLIIKLHMIDIKNHKNNFSGYYSHCRSGATLEEIAALLGHASIKTATAHYGRRTAGIAGRFKVNANKHNVGKVKQLNTHLPTTVTRTGQASCCLINSILLFRNYRML